MKAPSLKGTEPKKGRSSIFGLLFRSLLAASVVYGGTLYVATKNDKVLDFVLDNELPYHDELMDFMENASLATLQSNLNQMGRSSSEVLTNLLSKVLTPAEQLQKLPAVLNVGSKSDSASKKNSASQRKPLQLPTSGTSDPVLLSTLNSFNELITSFDAAESKDPNLVRKINTNVDELAAKLAALTAEFEKELQKKVKSSLDELLASYTKKELELSSNMINQFIEEKKEMEQKLQRRMQNEIEAATAVIQKAAENAVQMARIDQTKRFEQFVVESINKERDGRLAKLNELNSNVRDLEKFAESAESQLEANHRRAEAARAVSKLRAALTIEDESVSRPFAPILESVEDSLKGTNDEVLVLALGNLKQLLANESTQSLLSPAQLSARWDQLASELRLASLLPPNAGLLGHLSSLLFSKLLVPVKGDKPNANDIELVIARVQMSLTRGQLDVAVEEAANMKGWTRRLADDWVVAARKKLEAQFLLGLIESEVRVL